MVGYLRLSCVAMMYGMTVACFDLNGPNFGGHNERCWTDPKIAPCEDGLQCVEGRCRTATATATATTCSTSLECNTGQACVGGTCAAYSSTCAADLDCRPDFFCHNAACAKRAALGTACAAPNQCTSRYCADGVCCDGDCVGTCLQCSVAGHCSSVISREDPGTCDDANGAEPCTTPPCRCNDVGACAGAPGVACDSSGDCDSGFCVEGVCCKTACTETCMACVASKTAGSTGTCSSVFAQTDPDDECSAACSGKGSCQVANGSPCQLDVECGSGVCSHSVETTTRLSTDEAHAAGICCDQNCDDICKSCYSDTTAADDPTRGVCHDEPRDADEFGDCGATACGGPDFPQCTLPLGRDCSDDWECFSGACGDSLMLNSVCH